MGRRIGGPAEMDCISSHLSAEKHGAKVGHPASVTEGGSAPALQEEDADGEGGGEGRAGEVHGVVAEAVGRFEGCSQQAVDEGSEEGGAQGGPVEAGNQQIGPLAAEADDDDGGEREDGAGEGDSAVLTGRDLAPGGDQPRAAAESLAEFTADRVTGSFGQSR